jgi:hypothetical protein
MIAYEDLVVALTNWRINQGMPTSAVTFLSQDTGSVDLELPVADPLVTGDVQEHAMDDLGVEEIAADDLGVEEYAADGYEAEEVPAEAFPAEEDPTDGYVAEAAEGYAEEEVPTSSYESEDAPLEDYAEEAVAEEQYAAAPETLDPTQTAGLDYDDDTQYGDAPEGVDRTQEMSIESVMSDDEEEASPLQYDPNSDEAAALAALQAEDAGGESEHATEEVPRLVDDEAADSVEHTAAEAQAYAEEEAPIAAAQDEAGDVDFGGDDDFDAPAEEPADIDPDPPVEQ